MLQSLAVTFPKNDRIVSGFTFHCDIYELIILDSLNTVLVDYYHIVFLCNLFIYRIQ